MMKQAILISAVTASILTGCATTGAISPEQKTQKKAQNFKRLEWLLGTETAQFFMDNPNRPVIIVDNKKLTPADQKKYKFDISPYEYLGDLSYGVYYAVKKDKDGNYRSGYIDENGKTVIPFKFGHTNKDTLASRQYTGGYASVINYEPSAQIYREEGAPHPKDQYAIIDWSGTAVVGYGAYSDIQRYPEDNYFTAFYIDEKGQKRTSKISTNIKLLSDVAGWNKR